MEQNTALPGKTVIVVCDAMLLHLQAAQEKMGTSFPVVEIDRKLHVEPKEDVPGDEAGPGAPGAGV